MSWRAWPVGLLAGATLVGGPAMAKVQAVIVEWGEVQVEPGAPLGPEYHEHSLGQGRGLLSSRYVNHDSHLPAQLCRGFGITAWFAAGPGDILPDRVLLRIHHPMLTRPDGAQDTEDSMMVPLKDGAIGNSWTFDEPYEVQAGAWTFDLVMGGEVVASKTFDLTTPTPDNPRPQCPGRAVS